MSNWPDKPLIRIVRGYAFGGRHICNEYALRTADGDYLIDGERLESPTGVDSGDRIDEWEEVTAVPTAALKRLQGAFRGIDVIKSLEPPLLEVLSYLPADKPSALDQAVTRVKDEGGPMISEGDSTDNRLSLLFDALASIPIATNKAAPLTTVARICVDWANIEEPYCDALREIAGRAGSDPARIGFVGLAAFAGDIAASLDDGTNGGPRNDLLEMGHYALAWAAQIIKEEDTHE